MSDLADSVVGADLASLRDAELGRMIADTPRARLRAAIEAVPFDRICGEIIRRIPAYVDTEAAADVHATIAWEIHGRPGTVDRFLLVISGGRAIASRQPEELGQPAESEDPRVTLSLHAADFLLLATGNDDPAAMVLSGVLDVTGAVAFALELTRYLRLPGSSGHPGPSGPPGPREPASLDGPAASGGTRIDVAAIARAVGQTPENALRDRLRGPLRDVLLDEVFGRMPEYLDPGAAAGVNATVQWQISGGGHGRFDEFRVTIADGACAVDRGPATRPTCSVRVDPAVFIKLVTSNVHPVTAFLSGKLSVRGDLMFAGRLPSLFTMPQG